MANKLPQSKFKRAVELHRQGLNNVEIGKLLKISEGTVRKWKKEKQQEWDQELSNQIAEDVLQKRANGEPVDGVQIVTQTIADPAAIKEAVASEVRDEVRTQLAVQTKPIPEYKKDMINLLEYFLKSGIINQKTHGLAASQVQHALREQDRLWRTPTGKGEGSLNDTEKRMALGTLAAIAKTNNDIANTSLTGMAKCMEQAYQIQNVLKAIEKRERQAGS